MKYTLLSIYLAMCLSCSNTNPSTVQTDERASNQISHFNELNYSFLDNHLKGKEIVALGESTHGLGEFYTIKSSLIEYLFKEHNYEVLVFESGFGEINLAWTEITDMDATELRDNTVFSNFQCREVEPLFDLIKNQSESDKPLYYAGVDIQTSSSYYTNTLKEICAFINLDIDIDEDFTAYNMMYRAAFNPDSTDFIKHRETYKSATDIILGAIIKNQSKLIEADIVSKNQLILIKRNLEMQNSSVSFDYADRLTNDNTYRGMVLRDSLMYENFKWLKEKLYPNKKMILWAHNAHVEKQSTDNRTTKWLGQYLSDEYKDQYFALGLFAMKGTAYQHWTGESMPFDNSDSTFVSSLMTNNDFKYSFLPLSNSADTNSWVHKSIQANEFENGQVNFIPSERFDAMLTLSEGGIPTYE